MIWLLIGLVYLFTVAFIVCKYDTKIKRMTKQYQISAQIARAGMDKKLEDERARWTNKGRRDILLQIKKQADEGKIKIRVRGGDEGRS